MDKSNSKWVVLDFKVDLLWPSESTAHVYIMITNLSGSIDSKLAEKILFSFKLTSSQGA